MAASGIAEHNEALRRQHVVNRRAYITKQLIDKYGQDYTVCRPPTTTHDQQVQSLYEHKYDDDYSMRKLGSPPGMTDYRAPITDKLRREHVRRQELVEYSAKIPHRFGSINYMQQW